MENKKWYAVMTNHYDDDWGTGSFDKEEAMRMVIDNIDKVDPYNQCTCEDGYIAVIENDTCVEEIEQEDFDAPYYYAARIVKAKDWDEARDDIEHLMYWLDMEKEWNQADDMTFEDVIHEEGKKIGVELV